jgi:hypothetical protein
MVIKPHRGEAPAQAPETSTLNNEKSGLPLWTKVTAVVGGLATAGTIGFMAARGGEEAPAPGSTQPVAAASADPTDLLKPVKQPSEMTPAEFSALRLESKLDYVGPILNSDTEATTARLNAALDELGYAGYNYFNRPVVQPSLSNSTQEISDQMTLADFQAWELSNQGTLKMDEAIKIADTITRGREYNDLTELFGKPTPVIPLKLAWEQTREQIPNTGEYAEFDNVISYTEQNILSEDPYNPEYVKVTAGFVQGNVENSGVWVLIKTNNTTAPSA